MDNPPKESPKNKSTRNPFLRFSVMAFQMGILIAVAAWGGSELDTLAGNEMPIYALILCLLAIGISLYLIIKEALKLSNDDK